MNLNQKTIRLSRLALFSALILLLNYTPLGYIRVFAAGDHPHHHSGHPGCHAAGSRRTAPFSAASLA